MSEAQKKFQEVDSRANFGELAEKILKFWKKDKTFEKSIAQRPKDNPYVFYDGPPFVTGLPHYGSLLPSIAKDLIPRYWTMKGKRVERVWGWDCHGLPVENKVEKEMGLNSRREIEKIGLDKFIPECQKYVANVSSEWEWYIDRVGRWVDFKNAYRTMDADYMESVWWVFKTIYDKDLVYKGKRVSLYCPRCGTPISNFEVAMDNSYKEVTEPSNTYKYQLTSLSIGKLSERVKGWPDKASEHTYVLAWSTTPWNKLATPSLAINPKLTYVLIKQNDEFYILAKTTLKNLKKDPYEVIVEFSGEKLENLHFKPHYDFYTIPKGKNAWVIVGGDFVSDDAGTGVVTLAVYGEDDYKIMQAKNIALLEHVDEEGHLTIDQEPWKGIYYLKANKLVNQDLEKRGLMYSEEKLTHSVPECWRCSTRLMFSPQDAWFIRVSEMKNQLLKTNENIYWFPNHLKHGRFQKGLESAPDWCISRSRYWATPMPVWVCDAKECGDRTVISSRSELEKLSGKKVTDMHRPYIDEHTFKCTQCANGTKKRIPDVLDSWMDAGSMPYAQKHYPFENKKEFEASFPGDYIIEYIAQTRAWFYVMHVLSNALFETNSFKNVICTGVISGTDGRKMSKSYGNYPDPKMVIDTYGGDALRLYMMSSPVMAAENMNLNEDEIKEQNQRVLSILWNSYNYFVTYANLHNFKPSGTALSSVNSDNILDIWLLAKLRQLAQEFTLHIEQYNIPKAVRKFRPFVTELSTWYIRRSRDRFVAGDKSALQTLYTVLYNLSLVMAPTTPFITEEIYQNLATADFQDKHPQSVHLNDWPELGKLTKAEEDLLENMEIVKEVASLGNAVRKQLNLPLRQPLAAVQVKHRQTKPKTALCQILLEELNVKDVKWEQAGTESEVTFDTNLTKELKDEGEARNLIRTIQEARKKAGVERDLKIILTLPDWPKAYEAEIKQKAMVKELKKGAKIEIIS